MLNDVLRAERLAVNVGVLLDDARVRDYNDDPPETMPLSVIERKRHGGQSLASSGWYCEAEDAGRKGSRLSACFDYLCPREVDRCYLFDGGEAVHLLVDGEIHSLSEGGDGRKPATKISLLWLAKRLCVQPVGIHKRREYEPDPEFRRSA